MMNYMKKLRKIASEIDIRTRGQESACIFVSRESIVRYFGEDAWKGILEGTIADMGELYPYLDRKRFFQDVLK
jgi:hypothetical protein